MPKTRIGLSENVTAALAYSIPITAVISGIILLIVERENKVVRFHAMQSFVVFGFLGVVATIISFIPLIGGLIVGILSLIGICCWVVLIVSALLGKMLKFPLVGDVIYEQIMK